MNISKSKPIRSCIGCGVKKEQSELTRLVLDTDDDGTFTVVWDKMRSIKGRGAWLCKNSSSCLKVALKKKSFAKAFKIAAQLNLTGLEADSNR